ncbi:hypothetical protein NMG60_11000670 [Bertholletia excelsa]
MLTCITCSKQRVEEEEVVEGARGTPSTKEAAKSLTAQIKDMALKMSSAYRQCKPCTGSGNYKKGRRAFPSFETISEGAQYPYPYLQPPGQNSNPAWDFASTGRHLTLGSDSSRFTRSLGGDQTPGGLESVSAQSGDVVLEDEDEPKEWMAQVEPGVQITFMSLPQGGNDLRRIRFSRDMFNKWQAQRWWGENYDRIMELYNVQRFNRQGLHTPARSEDEQRDSSYSRFGSARESPMTPPLNKEWMPRNHYRPSSSKGYPLSEPSDHGGSHHCSTGVPGGPRGETASIDASRTTTSSRDEPSVSISNASDIESEWVEQDEPGVYITIRQLTDGTRELRRVRFSRERFGEANAKTWWEENRERIQTQYL